VHVIRLAIGARFASGPLQSVRAVLPHTASRTGALERRTELVDGEPLIADPRVYRSYAKSGMATSW
jgi:hypothetical protein